MQVLIEKRVSRLTIRNLNSPSKKTMIYSEIERKLIVHKSKAGYIVNHIVKNMKKNQNVQSATES